MTLWKLYAGCGTYTRLHHDPNSGELVWGDSSADEIATAETIAVTCAGNVLRDDWAWPEVMGDCKRILSFSGSLADSMWDSHPPNWLTPGQTALRRYCDDLEPRLRERGMVLCFQPHCRHVLSDPASCVKFLDDMQGRPFEVALTPTAFLEQNMFDDIEDHLTRAFELLGARCSLVFLWDIADPPSWSTSNGVTYEPLGRGRLPRDPVHHLLDKHMAPATPLVLCDEDLASQLAWLGIDPSDLPPAPESAAAPLPEPTESS